MNVKTVTVRNKETGRVGIVPLDLAEHEIHGKHLEIVKPGAKDLISISELIARKKEDEEPTPEEEPIEADNYYDEEK